MATQELVVRPCETLDELEACVDLQMQIWGYSERDAAPAHVLVVAAKTGGHVLGAFVGSRQVGFALAFAARDHGRDYLYSHMVAVLPEYRDRGIGRALKLKQREQALAQGLGLIEWTFDPLEIKNAHFNIAGLGVIIRQYLPDHYGRTSSPLHAGLPTDRLLAEWWLNSSRVRATLSGKCDSSVGDSVRISVPVNLSLLRRSAPAEAQKLQTAIRSEFLSRLQAGFAVTGFEYDSSAAHYILQPASSVELG